MASIKALILLRPSTSAPSTGYGVRARELFLQSRVARVVA